MPDSALFVGGPLDGQLIVVDHWPYTAMDRSLPKPISHYDKLQMRDIPAGMDYGYVEYYPIKYDRGLLLALTMKDRREAERQGYIAEELLRGAALRRLFEAVKQERVDPPDNDDEINAAMDMAEQVLDAVRNRGVGGRDWREMKEVFMRYYT